MRLRLGGRIAAVIAAGGRAEREHDVVIPQREIDALGLLRLRGGAHARAQQAGEHAERQAAVQLKEHEAVGKPLLKLRAPETERRAGGAECLAQQGGKALKGPLRRLRIVGRCGERPVRLTDGDCAGAEGGGERGGRFRTGDAVRLGRGGVAADEVFQARIVARPRQQQRGGDEQQHDQHLAADGAGQRAPAVFLTHFPGLPPAASR